MAADEVSFMTYQLYQNLGETDGDVSNRADKGGIEGWVRLVGAQLFELIEVEKEREACVKEVVDVLEIVCKQPDESYAFTYVRLRVVARKISR